jgi:hypothetical protein
LVADAKKVLGFSDNRQDAALQAGHFNDFVQVLLTRAALLAAFAKSAGQALSEKEVANAVFEALCFDRDDPVVRAEYMQQPEVKGNTRRQVQDAMRSILGYRTFFDLRRGWRFNNPNLDQLGLVRKSPIRISTSWPPTPTNGPTLLRCCRRLVCRNACTVLRAAFRDHASGLMHCHPLPRPDRTRPVANAELRQPPRAMGFTEEERPVPARWFVTRRPRDDVGPRGRKLNLDDFLVIGSSRSRIGRELKKSSTWGGGTRMWRRSRTTPTRKSSPHC